MLDKLQKRIQSLVPEIIDKEFINLPIARDIKLEDVLVAIESLNDMKLDQGRFYFNHGNIALNFYDIDSLEQTGKVYWRLNIPLHLQSKECIEFLYKLLVTDK